MKRKGLFSLLSRRTGNVCFIDFVTSHPSGTLSSHMQRDTFPKGLRFPYTLAVFEKRRLQITELKSQLHYLQKIPDVKISDV